VERREKILGYVTRGGGSENGGVELLGPRERVQKKFERECLGKTPIKVRDVLCRDGGYGRRLCGMKMVV